MKKSFVVFVLVTTILCTYFFTKGYVLGKKETINNVKIEETTKEEEKEIIILEFEDN